MKLAALALAVVFASVSVSVSVADPSADPAKLSKDREAAAAAVYPLLVAEWSAGRRAPSELGAWSIRWLDASLDAGAAVDKSFADHLTRMTELETKEQSMVKAGLASPSDAGIATYFRTEAALWKSRGKK